MLTKRVAVLVSGGGTNLQALLDAADGGNMPHVEIALVIASRPDVYALERAKNADVCAETLPRKGFSSNDSYDIALLEILKKHSIDYIVLAGFLCILGERMIHAYQDKIINVHPSLIPSFCGEGMYGLRVHEEALKRGVKVTGATVHIVNTIVDGGRILQQKAVAVKPGDTPERLQKRVMEEAEWIILPAALEMLCSERMDNHARN